MRRTASAFFLSLAFASAAFGQYSISPGLWTSYGGNAQHTADYFGFSQPVSNIHWQASLDDNRSYYGSEVLIHYASPVVTPFNTVVHSYRYTSSNLGTPYYDNWQVIGRSGFSGGVLWSMTSDYSAPVLFPADWTSVFPLALVSVRSQVRINFPPRLSVISVPVTTTAVVAAGSGGTILIKNSADSQNATLSRIAFYTTAKDYNNNAGAYSPVKINTPLTTDAGGNVYFGYMVTGNVPSNLANLGTGGIAMVNPSTGSASYISTKNLNINSNLSRAAMNAAPAVSNDGMYLYVALSSADGSTAYLAKLNTSDLSKVTSTQLMDPAVPGGGARLINESSASPMVGPDGNVFMGVFDYGWRESHGWMLQFDQNLNQKSGPNTTFPVGAFGWDDTASIVPSYLVPSYKGTSSYLLLTKYNNYAMDGDAGADGQNHVALLDPSSNSVSKDRQSGILVMNEVMQVLSPTPNPTSQHPNGRTEWCINSAAVDIYSGSAIINCEDGHVYRWNFATNTLSQGVNLQPATGEAYTSTVIGPDGTVYAINNSILFAVGW